MAFPGRIYYGEQGNYLAAYNFFPDIWMACPNSLEGKSERVAHVTYGWGGYRRAIDIFKLKEKCEIPEIKFAPPIKLNRRWMKGVDKRQDIQYQVKKGRPKETLDIAREDIRTYIKTEKDNLPAKNLSGTNINRVSVLESETEVRYINPWEGRILTPGKPEFVPQCGNYANIDFTKGCVTSLVSENAVMDLTQNRTKGIYIAPWNECSYCYAQNKHKSALKNFYKIDWQQLKEELLGKAKLTTGSDEQFRRKIKRLRFGKRTEAASLLTRPQFIRTLEICVETGTQGVIPTKFLEYNSETTDLLRRTNSVVLYSIGLDDFEKGAVSFGCTNDWRLEQAVKYGERGVKTAIYLMITNPIIGPNERDKKVIDFIEKNRKNLTGVQLLPMRFKSKKLALEIAGIHWDDAKSDKHLLTNTDEHIGNFEVIGGELGPKKFHPFWLDLIKNNKGFYRMCHHTNENVWCGGCFTKPGLYAEHKRIPVNAVKKIPRPQSRRKKKKKKNKHKQLDLF